MKNLKKFLKQIIILGVLILILIILKNFNINQTREKSESNKTQINILKFLSNDDKNDDNYSKEDFIFIGGYPRSGTTLMRAILDVHPNLNCGPETKILPLFLDFIKNTKNRLMHDMRNANLDDVKLDKSVSQFINNILNKHNSSIRKCTKDPNILYHIKYLHSMFPNAKFVYMVRDGRSVVYSLIKLINEPNTLETSRKYLLTWNSYNIIVYDQCKRLGPKLCKLIKYEDLVLNTKETVKEVVKFLNLTWTDEFLSHEKYVDNKIIISKTEWSSIQIKEKIYSDSVRSWVGKLNFIDENLVDRYKMFRELGYL